MLGRARLATLVVICAITAAGATVAGAGAAKHCIARHQTIAGHAAIAYCGPATATIVAGGRSYHFTHGTCVQSATVGAVEISLGTLVHGATGNAGRPFVTLLIAEGPSESEAFEGDYGGRQIFGDSVIAQNSNLLSHGSFASVLGSSFSGSWSCNGPIRSGR